MSEVSAVRGSVKQLLGFGCAVDFPSGSNIIESDLTQQNQPLQACFEATAFIGSATLKVTVYNPFQLFSSRFFHDSRKQFEWEGEGVKVADPLIGLMEATYCSLSEKIGKKRVVKLVLAHSRLYACEATYRAPCMRSQFLAEDFFVSFTTSPKSAQYDTIPTSQKHLDIYRPSAPFDPSRCVVLNGDHLFSQPSDNSGSIVLSPVAKNGKPFKPIPKHMVLVTPARRSLIKRLEAQQKGSSSETTISSSVTNNSLSASTSGSPLIATISASVESTSSTSTTTFSSATSNSLSSSTSGSPLIATISASIENTSSTPTTSNATSNSLSVSHSGSSLNSATSSDFFLEPIIPTKTDSGTGNSWKILHFSQPFNVTWEVFPKGRGGISAGILDNVQYLAYVHVCPNNESLLFSVSMSHDNPDDHTSYLKDSLTTSIKHNNINFEEPEPFYGNGISIKYTYPRKKRESKLTVFGMGYFIPQLRQLNDPDNRKMLVRIESWALVPTSSQRSSLYDSGFYGPAAFRIAPKPILKSSEENKDRYTHTFTE